MSIPRFFGRIENKIFLIIVLTTLASTVAIFAVMYNMFYAFIVEDITERADTANRYAQTWVSLDSFQQLHTRADTALPSYIEGQAQLNRIRQIANVRYLFTAKRNEAGEIVYLIDGLALGSEDFRFIGDPVEDEILPELNQCLSGKKVADDRILNTSWGAILLTCWPKFDENGRVAGAIVMEYGADDFYRRNISTTLYSVGISLVISSVFIALSSFLLRKVSLDFYKRLAFTDVLTGLNSRTAFERTLDSIDKRGDYDNLVCVVYDLNRLKYVNDTYGHAAGDAYLRKMGDVVRSLPFRASGHFRIGGDEFLSLVRRENVESVRKYLDELFERTRIVGQRADFFEFSYGVVAFDPEQDKSPRDTITRADAVMYAFKRERAIVRQ